MPRWANKKRRHKILMFLLAEKINVSFNYISCRTDTALVYKISASIIDCDIPFLS
jgi:hypothetical protein